MIYIYICTSMQKYSNSSIHISETSLLVSSKLLSNSLSHNIFNGTMFQIVHDLINKSTTSYPCLLVSKNYPRKTHCLFGGPPSEALHSQHHIPFPPFDISGEKSTRYFGARGRALQIAPSGP